MSAKKLFPVEDQSKYRRRLDIAREKLALVVDCYLNGTATKAQLKRASQKEMQAEHALCEAFWENQS